MFTLSAATVVIRALSVYAVGGLISSTGDTDSFEGALYACFSNSMDEDHGHFRAKLDVKSFITSVFNQLCCEQKKGGLLVGVNRPPARLKAYTGMSDSYLR